MKHKDKIHNVSRFKVKTKEFPCVLDMVKCSNPVVVNTLIDQRSIENVLLIEDSDTARQVMMRRPPENCRECFTLGGDQAFCQPTFRYYSSDKTTVRFLMADVQEQITLLQEQEKLIHGEMNALNQESKDKQSEMNKNQQLERGCRTKLNQIKEKISRDKFDIQELQSVEDPAPIDVTTLEEEVREYKSQIEVLKEQRHAVLEEKSDSEAKLQETKQSLEQVEEEIRQKSDDGIPLREAITQAQSELETARNNRKHYAGKLRDQEKKIQEIKKELERYKSDVETDKGKALQICEPIPTQRSPDNVESEIRQIERRVAEEERVQGSELEITETFKERKDTYMRVQKELQQLQNFLEKLDETMEKRQINYMEMRKNIANRTKYYFLRQMHHRGFTGKMMFEFNKGTLDILVNPGKDLSGSKDRKAQGSDDQPLEGCDLKSLSGGERSFSTVCFILALWEAMESPFRCLDEFDVFMDMVNRSISMDMMMKAASAYSDMQFVFLTPQDMSSQRRLKSCKIFRMPDPERTRNQSTIDFSQASTQ